MAANVPSYDVTFDTTTPTILIEQPVHDEYYSAVNQVLTTISGTAGDAGGNASGVAEVWLYVWKMIGTPEYYDGTSYSTTLSSVQATIDEGDWWYTGTGGDLDLV